MLGIASMVIGIVSAVFGFIPFCGTWALIPAIVGLVLGIIDLVQKGKTQQPKGMALAGVILCAVAIIVILCWWFIFAAAGAASQLNSF